MEAAANLSGGQVERETYLGETTDYEVRSGELALIERAPAIRLLEAMTMRWPHSKSSMTWV